MSSIILAAIMLDERKQLRLSIERFREKQFIDLRVWIRWDGSFSPTRKGIVLDKKSLLALRDELSRLRESDIHDLLHRSAPIQIALVEAEAQVNIERARQEEPKHQTMPSPSS